MATEPNQGLMAQPAQPDQAAPDDTTGQDQQDTSPAQQRLFQQLLGGLLDWVWGKGKPDIQRQLQQAQDNTLPVVIGHITFALVQQGVEQGEKAGHSFDTDLLMGVATELIESLAKMAAGMNMQFDAKALAMRALVQVLSDYADTLPDGSQAQQEAQQAMQELGPQGMQQGADALRQVGQDTGTDPFAQSQGQPAPTAGAPQQGLMGAQDNA